MIPVLERDDHRLIGDVITLSTYFISQEQMSTLSASIKLRQAPKTLPPLQLVAGAEYAARQLKRIDGMAAESCDQS